MGLGSIYVELLLFIWVILALLVGWYARGKGHSFFVMFLFAMILSSPVVFLIEAIRSPNIANQEKAKLRGGDWKKCPSCAELVKIEATKCRFCGEQIEVV